MLVILIVFFSGIFIGVLFKSKTSSSPNKLKKTIKSSDNIIEYSVFLLLVLLGIMVGKSDKIISSITEIGIKALVITMVSILFSVVFAYIFYKLVKYDK